MSPTRRSFVKLALAAPVAALLPAIPSPVSATPQRDRTLTALACVFLDYANGDRSEMSTKVMIDADGTFTMFNYLTETTSFVAGPDERFTLSEFFERMVNVHRSTH